MFKISSIRFIRLLFFFGFSVISGICTQALAQTYPNKPIEWVVPYPAGGGTDIVARLLAEPMGKSLGQSIIVVNKPGAATIIGADYLTKAKPDGYTIMSADTGTLAANQFIYKKLPYDTLTSFTPAGMMVRFNMILVVNPKIPANNWAEFFKWAKEQPQGVNFATLGVGSPHHLAAELLAKKSGLTLHSIAYRGASPAVQDVVGGQVPAMFVDSASGFSMITAGKLKTIALANTKRIESLPQIATFAEQNLSNFEAYAWQGLILPAGTSNKIVKKINQSLFKTLSEAHIRAKLQSMGVEVIPSTDQHMQNYVQAEQKKWGELIKSGGISVD